MGRSEDMPVEGRAMGLALISALELHGFRVPSGVQRMVVDIEVDSLVRVYYSCTLGNEQSQIFNQVMADALIDLGDEKKEGGGG